MAMRARVYDDWTRAQLAARPDALVLHVGCGLDSRVLRVGATGPWVDVDLPDVIRERRTYYRESASYRMLGGDARCPDWLSALPDAKHAVVLLEGIAMYLRPEDTRGLFLALQNRYKSAAVLMDVYTTLGARASKRRNPINTVGVTRVYGTDAPDFVASNEGIRCVGERVMTPRPLAQELRGADRAIFSILFAGRAARAMYRLWEYAITAGRNPGCP